MSEIVPISYEVLKFIVESVVNHPAAVEIKVSQDEDSDTVYMDVLVADTDRGRVIGKRGRTADTIRTVMHSVSVQDDKVVEVDFLDG